MTPQVLEEQLKEATRRLASAEAKTARVTTAFAWLLVLFALVALTHLFGSFGVAWTAVVAAMCALPFTSPAQCVQPRTTVAVAVGGVATLLALLICAWAPLLNGFLLIGLAFIASQCKGVFSPDTDPDTDDSDRYEQNKNKGEVHGECEGDSDRDEVSDTAKTRPPPPPGPKEFVDPCCFRVGNSLQRVPLNDPKGAPINTEWFEGRVAAFVRGVPADAPSAYFEGRKRVCAFFVQGRWAGEECV